MVLNVHLWSSSIRIHLPIIFNYSMIFKDLYYIEIPLFGRNDETDSQDLNSGFSSKKVISLSKCSYRKQKSHNTDGFEVKISKCQTYVGERILKTLSVKFYKSPL